MAINRLKYRITFDEAIRTLDNMRVEEEKRIRDEGLIGNTKAEVLGWTIRRLKRLEFAADTK